MFDINREHPDYRGKAPVWKMYRDLYVGGDQLRSNAQQYLIPRQKEPAEVYRERLGRVFYENYIGSIVDWYTATLFRREPTLTYDGTHDAGKKFFNEFIDDCDRRGTTLWEFLRKQFINALVDGVSYTLVDFPRFGAPAGNRAEEDALGVSRAFLVGCTAQQLINWSVDEHGAYEWVVLRTESQRKPRIEDEDWATETRWLYYDKTEFRSYRQSKTNTGATGPIELVDSGPHGLAKQNRVPLFGMNLQEGLWLLNRAGSLQMEHFNKSNALSWALTMGLFAMPVVYTDRKFNQMVGESYYIQLGPGDKFGWTEPEGRVYEIAADNLTRLQEEIYRVCYLAQLGGPVGSERSQSGLSKQRDFAITHEVLRAYGDGVKDLANRVLRAVADAREDSLSIHVAGMDEFDIGDFTNDLSDAERLLQMGIPSATLRNQIFRKLALKYLCDARQSVKDQIAAEIDTGVKKPA